MTRDMARSKANSKHHTKKASNPTSPSLEQLAERCKKDPGTAENWRAYLQPLVLIRNRLPEALAVLEKAERLHPDNPDIQTLYAKAEYDSNLLTAARERLYRCIEKHPSHLMAYHDLLLMLFANNEKNEAIRIANQALAIDANNETFLLLKGCVQESNYQLQESLQTLKQLSDMGHRSFLHAMEMGNVHRELGEFELAEQYYRQGIDLSGTEDANNFSNLITTLHYDPRQSAEDIFNATKQWNDRYSPKNRLKLPPRDKTLNRRLRIGLMSDGFRKNPVGMMITAALENIPPEYCELIGYSTNTVNDEVTQRIRACCSEWYLVQMTYGEELAQKIVDDDIDILIDMAGFNNGSRMTAVARKPAPIIIKWVGGLIDSTTVPAIDYLISDNIETPEGSDAMYTEKLIRMRDDYICYTPPLDYAPTVGALPAQSNGYITFGCFNNACKLNEVIAGQWSEILKQVPNSRLFLKTQQLDDDGRRERVIKLFSDNGITEEQLILEGGSGHYDLLNCYNRIDIALDPWPYSGGLTTCEALLMGVPVITQPGPTFAGRHSATHLINVGLSDLVVDSWEAYVQLAANLANDIELLTQLRGQLRQQLLDSPVCDGKRFGAQLADVLRVIWERYCEGKPAAALSVDKSSALKFSDEAEPREPAHPPRALFKNGKPEWYFKGTVVTIDQGAQLLNSPQAKPLLNTGLFDYVAFDPTAQYKQQAATVGDKINYLPHTLLTAEPAEVKLYGCLSPSLSGTLEPFAQNGENNQQPNALLATLPIQNIAMGQIDFQGQVDWILIDHCNLHEDLFACPQMTEALIIDLKLYLQPVSPQQLSIDAVCHWALENGFEPLFSNYRHQFKANGVMVEDSIHGDAVYVGVRLIPSATRRASLPDNRKVKLAFLLTEVYKQDHLAKSILESCEQAFLRPSYQPYQPAPQGEIYHPLVKKNSRKVCLAVPVYNEEAYIAETIKSLREQSFDDVEFYISDNASTDRTFEIICDLAAGDDRFTLHRQPENLGALTNFHKSLTQTESHYFMWLGGHDYLSPELIKNACKILDTQPDVSMVCGQPLAVLDNKVLGRVEEALYDFTQPDPLTRYAESVAQISNCTIYHSMFRRKQLEGFELRQTLSHDHVLISHLLRFGILKYLDDDYFYRRYFGERETKPEERMLGKHQTMPRSEFYNYYISDFRKLFANDKALDTHAKQIHDLLSQRFGPA